MIVLLIGCILDDPSGGTAVGNPTGLIAQVADGGDHTASRARAVVDYVRVADCDGATRTIPVNREVDLLGGSVAEIEGGAWCSLEVAFAGPVEISAVSADLLSVSLSLDVDRLSFHSDAGVATEHTWLLELASPGWLSVENLGGVTDVVPGSATHDLLVDIVLRDSKVIVDDGDGRISDIERESAAFTTGNGDSQRQSQDSDGDTASDAAEEDDDADSDSDGAEPSYRRGNAYGTSPATKDEDKAQDKEEKDEDKEEEPDESDSEE